jgi:hypothetical protein
MSLVKAFGEVAEAKAKSLEGHDSTSTKSLSVRARAV